MTDLTQDEKDAVGEIFNLAIGQSASNLSTMLREEIQLTVPSIKFLPRIEALEEVTAGPEYDCCAIRQNFGGSLNGESWLVFPATKSLELVRSLLDELDDLEDMTDLEQEALGEVGNVVLNSCLATLANHLELQLDVDLPEVYSGETRDQILPTDSRHPPDLITMLVDVGFTVKNRMIEGQILVVLELQSMKALVAAVDRYLEAFLD